MRYTISQLLMFLSVSVKVS